MAKRFMNARASIFALVLALAVAIPAASASIVIEPLQGVYNVGDDFSVNVTIARGTPVQGFVSAELRCDEGGIEIYKAPLRMSAGEQKQISLVMKFERFLIGSLRNACRMEVKYSNESARSEQFEISSLAVMFVRTPAAEANPGSIAAFAGYVNKKNGKPLEGVIEAQIAELQLATSAAVSNGTFNVFLALPSNARARTYSVFLHAIERDSEGVVSNEGNGGASLKVQQVLTRATLALNSVSLLPGSALNYRVLAYDQADEQMIVKDEVTLIAPERQTFWTREGYSMQLQQWDIPHNAIPGRWTLSAEIGSLHYETAFEVAAVKNVSFRLESGLLIVTNTGNVAYDGPLEVVIGNTPTTVDAKLNVGESAQYRLSAPEGEHAVRVSAANTSHDFGNVFLTGKSVSVKNADSRGISIPVWIWWMIVLLIVAALVLHFYRKVRKRAYWGRGHSEEGHRERAEQQRLRKVHSLSHAAHDAVAPTRMAPPSLLQESGGIKEKCAIVALSVKNLAQLEHRDSAAAATIAQLVHEGKKARAIVQTQDSHKLFILAPSRAGNVLEIAVQLARTLERVVRQHNLTYALKLSAGIGVHEGEIILEQSDGEQRVTAVGTTILAAKRLAERAQHEQAVYVSDDVYHALVGRIKVDKVADKTWRLRETGQSRTSFLKQS